MPVRNGSALASTVVLLGTTPTFNLQIEIYIFFNMMGLNPLFIALIIQACPATGQ